MLNLFVLKEVIDRYFKDLTHDQRNSQFTAVPQKTKSGGKEYNINKSKIKLRHKSIKGEHEKNTIP